MAKKSATGAAILAVTLLLGSSAFAAENSMEREAQDRAQMTVFAAGGPSVPARVAAAGREVDERVRSNGQWWIQSRDVAPK